MKIYYDFHIHTALSPCGDEDMTPNNIVNMARIKGLDAICITDHNSCENLKSCIEVGEKTGIIVIPGMELQTREDIHVVCMFKNLNFALGFQNYVYNHLPNMKNDEHLLGKQVIYDSMDNIIGINDRLLLNSVDISFDDAFKIVKDLNGLFIPAHVDKDNFSVIASIGFLPDYLPIKAIEYVRRDRLDRLIKSGFIQDKYNFIKSSDAHYLQDISEAEYYLEVNDKNIESIFKRIEEVS